MFLPLTFRLRKACLCSDALKHLVVNALLKWNRYNHTCNCLPTTEFYNWRNRWSLKFTNVSVSNPYKTELRFQLECSIITFFNPGISDHLSTSENNLNGLKHVLKYFINQDANI